MPEVDIVVIGELHDNALHHANQAKLVRALAPTALVFEMLSPEQAEQAASADKSVIAELDAALGWTTGPWSGFHMYYPIFAAAPEARIYGAAVDPDIVRASVSEGAAAKFGDAAEKWGLTQKLPPDQQSERETGQADAHCNALPSEMLPGFVEAQRLRDASFARTAFMALQDTGGPVVVITGNGHARKDWGIPHYLGIAAPEVSVLAIGQLPGAPSDPPFDHWIVTGQTDEALSKTIGQRGDPCAAFESN